jgi:hypothetical protein
MADATLTPDAGLAAVRVLCDRLGVIGALDAAVGRIEQWDCGFGARELLTGIAAVQLAGEDFLVALDRRRAGMVKTASSDPISNRHRAVIIDLDAADVEATGPRSGAVAYNHHARRRPGGGIRTSDHEIPSAAC